MSVARPLAGALAAALAAGLAAGCDFGGGADKAGGSRVPVVLRLAVAYAADEPDAPAARFFAARVAALSGGSLRVRVIFDAAGTHVPDPEPRVARAVRDDHFDLGWIGSRAWDELGVTSFQALQAPFLVTSYALLDRIATGPLASRMLAGLDGHGVVGLALVPDWLRHPIGVRRPLRSLHDFAGARVRVNPSRATDILMRALGATPVHLSSHGLQTAMARHEIDGLEASLGGTWAGGYVTANVSFYPKALTLVAGRRAYARLADDQRAALRNAARLTVARVAAQPPPEAARARQFCEGGSVVTASRDDTTALERAARPVYARLEQDPKTRELIAAIRELRATTPVPATTAPRACAHQAPTAHGGRSSPSELNGTYRWRLTKAGAVAAGNPDDPDIGKVMTIKLRDGKWTSGGGATGTYKVAGNRIAFDGSLTFTVAFERRANGDLDIRPVLPMDRGDRFNWASAPWRRVGPPIREIP
jgi:TRAP-type C4-dicarboxylate transport system substrate-binding protein